MISIDKQKILAGNRQELIELLRPHFLEAHDELDIEPSQRLELAALIWQHKKTFSDWSKGFYQQILQLIQRDFGDVPAIIKAEVRFSVMVLDVLTQLNNLSPVLQQSLNQLRLPMLVASLADKEFWVKNSALKQLFDAIYHEGLALDNNNIEKMASIYQLLIDAIKTLSHSDFDGLLNPKPVLNTLLEALADAKKRSDKLLARLKQSEEGALKAKIAHQQVQSFAYSLLNNKQLPLEIAEFLQQTLLPELQLLIIQQGLHSKTWIEQKKLLSTLVGLYQNDLALDTAVNKTLLQTLPDEFLKQAKALLANNQSALQAAYDKVAFDFAMLLSGKALTDLQLQNIDNEQDASQQGAAQLSSSQNLLEKIRQFQPGQWFNYRGGDGSQKRISLLLNMDDYDHLLFTNALGQKALSASAEEVAVLISSKQLQAYYHGSLTLLALGLVVDKLLENHSSLYASMLDKQQRFEQQLAIKKQALKEQQKRQEAAEKARQEAEALAATKAKHEAAKAQAERERLLADIDRDARRQIRLSLDSLSIGSWLEQADKQTGEYKRMKLAVKFNATGRFVFVNEDGVTMADIVRDELVDLILEEKVRLLESDQHFADRLAKIVKGIRSKEENNDR